MLRFSRVRLSGISLPIRFRITLLVVAGFGIYNILNMTIHNKMKDIAILKAMGFSGRDVKQIFMIQSLVIGFMGSLAGLVIGYSIVVCNFQSTI